ncbi:hypothetical protein [Butyrivibrio sp. MC2013]|uniref:hypothetical protein n=1 Tax=Butyrivibrio sp. MC2013 TaxID=1280686 RepID=UPI00040F7DF7|nr:hypothetical protein [Butyrivibrio sp. MC2013]
MDRSKIEEYGQIRFYNLKKKSVNEELAVVLINTADNDRIQAIGNDVFDDAKIVEYCSEHPEEKITNLLSCHRSLNKEHMEAFLRFFHRKHIMQGKYSILKGKLGAIVYHGSPDKDTLAIYTGFLENCYLKTLLIPAYEIHPDELLSRDAILALGEKYKGLSCVIEIDA